MTDRYCNTGSLGATTNHPQVDDGTSSVCQNRAKVSLGKHDNIFLADENSEEKPHLIFGTLDDPTVRAASLDAAKFVIGMELRHRAGIHLYGEGTQAGSDSDDFSNDEIERMSRGENVKNSAGKAPINCTELPLYAAKEYFESLGRPELGTQIDQASRDTRGRTIRGGLPQVESARLTGLIKELHDCGGFETVYLGQFEAPRLQGFAEVARKKYYPTFAYPVRGADSKNVIEDVRAPVDKALTRNGNRKLRQQYEEFVQRLTRTPFAIGAVDAGLHGFVIADGAVYEVHWTAKATSTHLFQKSTVREFVSQYADAIVAIPKKVP